MQKSPLETREQVDSSSSNSIHDADTIKRRSSEPNDNTVVEGENIQHEQTTDEPNTEDRAVEETLNTANGTDTMNVANNNPDCEVTDTDIQDPEVELIDSEQMQGLNIIEID